MELSWILICFNPNPVIYFWDCILYYVHRGYNTQLKRNYDLLNPNPLGIFTTKYPESTKIHQFCHTHKMLVSWIHQNSPVYILDIHVSWIRQNPPLTFWWILADSGYHAHMKICIVCCCIESHQNLHIQIHVTIIHQPTWTKQFKNYWNPESIKIRHMLNVEVSWIRQNLPIQGDGFWWIQGG